MYSLTPYDWLINLSVWLYENALWVVFLAGALCGWWIRFFDVDRWLIDMLGARRLQRPEAHK